MTLVVSVGVIGPASRRGAPGSARRAMRALDHVNGRLRAARLREHHEPDCVDPVAVLEFRLSGGAEIMALRRLAARIRAGVAPAPPTDAPPLEDPILREYYSTGRVELSNDGVAVFNSPGAPCFDHLVFHSERAGFYLPLELPGVIVSDGPAWLSAIGSSVTLARECEAIAAAIELPLASAPDLQAILALPATSSGRVRRCKGLLVQSLCCLQLHRACRRSLALGAAVVFHTLDSD